MMTPYPGIMASTFQIPLDLTADCQVRPLVNLWSICDIFVTFSSKSSFSLSTISVTEHHKASSCRISA